MKELTPSLIEDLKGRVILVFHNFLFEKFPKPFNQVQMRGVRGQVMERYVEPLRSLLYILRSRVSCIVQKHRDLGRLWIVLSDLPEENFGSFSLTTPFRQ